MQVLFDEIKNRLEEIYSRDAPPVGPAYQKKVEKVNRIFNNEDINIRPRDSIGRPGGLIYLKPDIPTVIVPDIHARMDFILSMLLHTNAEGNSILNKLCENRIQIVCVGDGFHSEARERSRWIKAFDEFKEGYKKHKEMDEEMRESFGVMEMVIELKTNFTENFHFLKGNHENISNEKGGGNYPFRKFAYEGIMVNEYVKIFYGEDFLNTYYQFEKNLPLLAIGLNFLISHAEPSVFYDAQSIIEYHSNAGVVEGLTWTDNDAAESGSVMKMIQNYLKPEYWEKSYYFGGHRPVSSLYNARAEGKYIQIHNPNRFIVAIIDVDKAIDLNTDIVEIKNRYV
jgi:hypothetical protein